MAFATITGNLGKEPVLQTSKNGGKPYAKFSIAWSERQRDANGQYFDGPTVWVNATAFGKTAEQVTQLAKGTRVTISGQLKAELWNSNHGEQTAFVMAVESLGVDITFQNVQVQKVTSNGGGQPPRQAQNDPWGSAPAPIAGGAEPPF